MGAEVVSVVGNCQFPLPKGDGLIVLFQRGPHSPGISAMSSPELLEFIFPGKKAPVVCFSIKSANLSFDY